jgi:predicted HTH domain antitoxin
MILELPQQLEKRLTKREAALHFAIGLFVDDETTLGQSAEIAGMSQSEFLRELGRRRIPIHYGMEELNADLTTVAALATA